MASATTGLYGGEGGAGGKIRKPPRGPAASPYARPMSQSKTATNSSAADGGWLSKIVHPARRLIASSASRFLPSFFSPSPPQLESTITDDHGTNKCFREQEQKADNEDQNCDLRLDPSKSLRGAGPSKVADQLTNFAASNKGIQEKEDNMCDNSGLSKIEELLKGKNFSRDEINRLTEILHSRAANLSNSEGEKKEASSLVGKIDSTLLTLENPGETIKKKEEEQNGSAWVVSTPHLELTIPDEIGASPVEIAKAYMGSRMTETGLPSQSMISKKGSLLRGDESASKPFFLSPSPKPSVCWPGAIIQEQSGYMTPQVRRGNFSLQKFPRTPYSRSVYSKPQSKLTELQGGGSTSLKISTPLQKSQTSVYGQNTLVKGSSSFNGYGSAGPIRRVRHRFVSQSASRGPSSLRSSQTVPPAAEDADIPGTSFPVMKKNSVHGTTSSSSKHFSLSNKPDSFEVSTPTAHPRSTLMAKQILEHLDRTVPSPKDKAAELKLASSWRKTTRSEVATILSNEQISSTHAAFFDSDKNASLIDHSLSQGNQDKGNLLSEVQTQDMTGNEAADSVNNTASASSDLGKSGTSSESAAWPYLNFNQSSDSQAKAHEEAAMRFSNTQKGHGQLWPFKNQMEGQDVVKDSNAAASVSKNPPLKPLFLPSKPVLPSTSVDKHDPKSTFTLDNNTSFSFPISSSSNILPEPPTPSVMPSMLQPKEGADIPSFTFGSKRSGVSLVFSFPSTSSAPVSDDSSNLKFIFGSEKKRISFAMRKDAVCY
ncbi:hypothetical protein RJ641_026214 [Dillenia turbinata]|uniref:Nuclear pore complex protein NUP1 n=1 Tax=Dillenia turbinata TaxID=194707 RepID=A0AAN8WB67_9MAGN